jgi:hypothetical protein
VPLDLIFGCPFQDRLTGNSVPLSLTMQAGLP